jgi:glycine dehydrogenase subunit 1
MLASIGVKSMADLFRDIPEQVRFKGTMNLPIGVSEPELAALISKIARKNATTDDYTCFLGGGVYDHYVPATINTVLSRNEFYTAYTPYQPEVSQGTLQCIFEYQTCICELTGMDVSQASMYDGATSVAEAVLMAVAISGRKTAVIASAIHPEAVQTTQTYVANAGVKIVPIPFTGGLTDMAALAKAVGDDTACVIVQSPNFFGCIEDVAAAGRIAHAAGAMFVVSADPISLGLLKPPSEFGADIVVGEGQSLGNSLYFGGPYLGFFACKEQYMRRIAGRVISQTTDTRGQRAFVLSMQTREQHIRREKATSNICSNEAMNALAALVYMTTMGKRGLRDLATLCLQKTAYAKKRLALVKGVSLPFTGPTFREFTIKVADGPKAIRELAKKGILIGPDLGRYYPALANHLLVAVTEKRSKEDIDRLASALEGLA